MRRLLRLLRNCVIVIGLVLLGLWFFGPREPMMTDHGFDAAALGDDLDRYLTRRESRFGDLTPGVQKRILWAGQAGARTDWAVIYLHGFSATSEEIRPVPDMVADRLGANLFFTRLRGHGRPGAAMAEPVTADWMHDLAEALAIGRRIGRRVLVLSTSTGGTLAVAGAADPGLAAQMDALVLISPNFGPADPLADLVTWPLARYWAPLIAGPWYEWQPRSPRQTAFWTTRYPTVATLPMMALVKHARGLEMGALDRPTLWIYSPSDKVVAARHSDRAFADWGGPKARILVEMGAGDDPSNHVIAGDILSPGRTAPTVDSIVGWVETTF